MHSDLTSLCSTLSSALQKAEALGLYGTCRQRQAELRAAVLGSRAVLRKQKSTKSDSVDDCALPVSRPFAMAAAMPVCYHGALTRKECEDLLGKKNKDGAYLIRDSETIQGAMCLCVYKQKMVYTYRLLQTHTGHYTLLTAGGVEETFFKTLDDLIRHYKRKNQGLAIHLRHSVKRKTALLIQPRSQREQSRPAEEEEPDYENCPSSSDYVEVLPDQL